MKRWAVLLYGAVNYVMCLAVLAYLAGFLGGFLTPTRLDGSADGSLIKALAMNSLLILVFGLQHSIMARPGFKRWWTRFVPEPIERSTYVLASNLALALLYWQWRPMGGVLWDIRGPVGQAAMWSLYAAGWAAVLWTTFLINHFDLFGLRQVWLYFRGRPYAQLSFVMPGPYRIVRHPLYVGWLTVFWATPMMTVAHFVFALGMTAYILAAIRFEERDLVQFHSGYAAYRRRVPMLVPCVNAVVDRPEAAANSTSRENVTTELVGSAGRM